MLPAALLPIAGLLALVIVWPCPYEQPSKGRLVVEAIGTTLVTMALVWAARVVLWWTAQRW